MEWLTTIRQAINYMEENLLTIRGPEEVADYVYVSAFYLQKGFQILTGYTLGEYIRCRRLYLAAMELARGDTKVIDIALRYGYETPESFTRAFTRFHGITPSEVHRTGGGYRTFFPLRISISVRGGENMDYTVEKMGRFSVIGFAREFSFEESQQAIPAYWDEIYDRFRALTAGAQPQNAEERAFAANRIGEFGVCIDDIGSKGRFRYMIAGRYMGGEVPEGMTVYELPEMQWAKFRCSGPLPEALQSVNRQIWNEWLPGNDLYELAGAYNIEWYSSAGTPQDQDYQSMIWIPVKTK